MTKFIIRRMWFALCGLILSTVCFAQDNNASGDVMRSNGKIYVVVAVCLTILLGLFLYVFMIDRKISRFEKEK